MESDLLTRLTLARERLKHHFGYTDFRPAQRRVVHSVLAGRNALAVLPTGAGKSICFQIPALVLDGFTIVVSPLISLMQDQRLGKPLGGKLLSWETRRRQGVARTLTETAGCRPEPGPEPGPARGMDTWLLSPGACLCSRFFLGKLFWGWVVAYRLAGTQI